MVVLLPVQQIRDGNYFRLVERVIGQLRNIGITARLQTMERGTFFDRLDEGSTTQERIDAWGEGKEIFANPREFYGPPWENWKLVQQPPVDC